MSIFSSLYIGMTGLRVNEAGLAVVGDNIANMNTVGFKASRAAFSDVLNQTIIGSAGFSEQGQGSAVQAIQRLHTQGALLQTGVSTDLAIGGNGFFVVRGEAQGGEGQFYTRNGQFRIDSEGFLTTLGGLRVQGYPALASGALDTSLGDLQVGLQKSPPIATTLASLRLNLDPNTDTVTDSAGPHYAASFTVFDSLGNAHDVDLEFTHQDDGSWTYDATVDGAEVSGGTPGDPPQNIGSGTLVFDTSGQLDEGASSITDFDVNFEGADPQTIAMDFAGSTGVNQPSSIEFVDQNGQAPGDLAFVTVEPDGTISGSFSNGDTLALGQLALALFQATDRLDAIGGNLYRQGSGTDEPAIGVANAGGRGEIFSGALEQSNVDLTNEFTQMITTQRGFQASSRTVSTANTLLGELVNLGR
ncbi:MAG: flagellar hook protein FlgE [Deltaproteobacteria bacterium]|nr:flagellar hook protein FlgE [Deltaproteobacteria bacterium]MCB9787798.1 flagellar hook protein FlgE [Deltaproteobacteria bacterium]